MYNPLLALEYEVAKKPIFCLEGKDLLLKRDAAVYVSNSVTDSIMYCTNGNIGLRSRSETETIRFLTSVMLSGVCHTIPCQTFLQSKMVQAESHVGAQICLVGLDCVIDGDSGTLSSVPRRTLSMRDGAFYSTCEDVLSSEGGLVFDTSYTRIADVTDLSLWGAEACYKNFRVRQTLTRRNSDKMDDMYASQGNLYIKAEASLNNYDLLCTSTTSKHQLRTYKMEFIATLVVELDDWAVAKIKAMDEVWQRSLTSGLLVGTTTEVRCVVVDRTLTPHEILAEVDVRDSETYNDNSPPLFTSCYDTEEGGLQVHQSFEYDGTSVSQENDDGISGYADGFGISDLLAAASKSRRRLTIKKRFFYTLSEEDLPVSVTLTFKARHRANGSEPLKHPFPSIAEMVRRRRESLDKFWATCCLDLQLHEELISNRTRMGLLYNAFRIYGVSYNLRNGLPRSGCSSIGKGLQYDLGCYIYHGIYNIITHPDSALDLLKSLYCMLPAARHNARHFCLAHGAVYPQCTITGECTESYESFLKARIYINAEIGYLIFFYSYAVEKITMKDRVMLLEMMLETARTWPKMGRWCQGRTVFRLDNLSGPDEYNDHSTGNFYVHLSAQQHIRRAVQFLAEQEKVIGSKAIEELFERINLTREDIAEMDAVRKAIFIQRNDRVGVYMVHDNFDSLIPWRGERAKHPLSLNYHPLSLYRHKIVNVPDVLLGMLLYKMEFGANDLERNVSYYTPLCTFDTPESLALVAIAQCYARNNSAQPIPFLQSLLHLDLDNITYAAEEGLHFGAMSAALITFIIGVGGVQPSKQALYVNPLLPAGVTQYSFTVCWRGAVLKTTLNSDFLTYELIAGESLRFVHGIAMNHIHLHTGFRRCQATKRLLIPRISHSQITQFEGCVFLANSLFHNILEIDYCSWYRVLEQFFDNYSTLHRRKIPPLTPEEFIDKVVYQCEEDGIAFSGIHKVLLAREINLDLGTLDDAEIVETRNGLANAKIAEMMELLAQEYPPVNPDLFALIRLLAKSGVALAIVTYHRGFKDFMLHHSQVMNLFVARINGEEVHNQGIRGRPHLDIFHCAAEKIHVHPSRCIVVAHHLDRGYCAEEMAKFRMFLDVEDPFVSSRVPLHPYPTLSEEYINTYQRDNPVVCRLLLKDMPRTIDKLEDIIDGYSVEDAGKAEGSMEA